MARMNDHVVAKVRAELAYRRVSRSELARRTGISPTSMARRLSGEVVLNLEEVEEIADALEVPPERLLSA